MTNPTPPTHATPRLQLRDVTVSYGSHRVLDGLTMTLPAGHVYGLVGLNGAGKSTLMNTIVGLTKHSGEVLIDGEPWRREHLARIGASINGPAFYPQLSAWDNLLVHARLTGTEPARIDEVLDIVGLNHTARKKAKDFSTGMKSRLAIAMALLTDPAIVMLDEPTNGLDPEAILELRTLVRDIASEGAAVMVSSHQLGEIEKTADALGVLTGGRLAYEGPLAVFPRDGESLEDAFFRTVGAVR